MVAVAGSVAAELISCYRYPGIRRALINNGGDIAFHLTPGESYRVAVCAEPEATLAGRKSWDAWLDLKAEGAIRGVATSGWRGRSFSLGIADAVTVLAADAGVADAAATMVANAVDVASPQVVRQPAASLKDDSDLGELLVTVEVKPLTQAEVAEALNRGLECASRLQNCGTIAGAALFLQGERRGLGAMRLHLADGADRRVAPHGDPILDGVT
jgi:ApbE superfamily uncharacterized protein (UPF0280 family)